MKPLRLQSLIHMRAGACVTETFRIGKRFRKGQRSRITPVTDSAGSAP